MWVQVYSLDLHYSRDHHCKAAKWSERKEAVTELNKLASTKLIAPGDFSTVCLTLKKGLKSAGSFQGHTGIGSLRILTRFRHSTISSFL
ncbi:protein MOR1-like [Henckelia pumila]|uniref:protein MOR1-like n=1 Tax=Henckelia pumila TaxID=405737 RepID=UPI003C6E4532